MTEALLENKITKEQITVFYNEVTGIWKRYPELNPDEWDVIWRQYID